MTSCMQFLSSACEVTFVTYFLAVVNFLFEERYRAILWCIQAKNWEGGCLNKDQIRIHNLFSFFCICQLSRIMHFLTCNVCISFS